MTGWVEEILRRFGQRAVLRRANGEEEATAFLQPVTERDEAVPETMTALGWVDGRLWLYLGRTPVRTGDIVAWNDMEFRVRSGRPHYVGGELSHWRAVLERKREDAE